MISVMLPKHRVGDEEDQVKGVGGHPVESSANFGRSLNAALHDGHLNSIEDLKGHKLPDNWMDMTHDWEGFKHFTLHGGIFLFLAMVLPMLAYAQSVHASPGAKAPPLSIRHIDIVLQ